MKASTQNRQRTRIRGSSRPAGPVRLRGHVRVRHDGGPDVD
ncbi:hypothetical protein [Pseudarthrobacter sp. NamB4]|nr:hypothetical protein [Pseudarthrobacter sp. NamB4]